MTSAPAPLVDAPVDATLDATAPAAGRGDRPATRPGLSPSRAGDFLQCPLLFRFRTIDRLPEPPSPAAARGTLVHAVLEHLFGLPAVERTLEAAHALVPEQWAALRESDPEVAGLFADEEAMSDLLSTARSLLTTYFTLEDPSRLEPAEREVYVVTELDDGPQLRGIVDRIDVAPNGWIRVVDYKTGRSPRAGYESSVLFQMRFYAFLLWRERGQLPKRLQLEFLGDGTTIQHDPSEAEMLTFEARIRSIWAGIQGAAESGDWRTRRSKLCEWCTFRPHCPEFGGTPSHPDPDAVSRATGVQPR